MSTHRDFVDHVHTQSKLGSALTFKRMFGEYALYLDGRVVAFACDNQLFVKPTAEGRALLGSVSEGPPYPGAKSYFRLDDELDDRDLLCRLLQVTAQALPPAKPKAARAARAARAANDSAKPRAPKQAKTPPDG